MSSAGVYSLNIHASYACRHSGACCTAGWAIPVEPHVRALVGAKWLVPDAAGACPQYDQESRLCRIHRDHGESMLPASCHHFPRRALIDDRGTFVTLSHFCPTAAALLVDSDAPLAIVSDPAAFPPDRGYEGLDARGEWPPLLRSNVLFDPESFALWERYLVETVSGSPHAVDDTLARIADVGEQVRSWSPGRGSLASWTAEVLAHPNASNTVADHRYARFSGPDAYVRVTEAVPPGLEAPRLAGSDRAEADARFAADWEALTPVLLRYLAARGFASWTAYQSRGIRTQIAELFVTAAVLRVECLRAYRKGGSRLLDRNAVREAVRASDLLLVHLADRQPLVAWFGEAENDESLDSTN